MGGCLEFTQYLVHDPVDGGGADAVETADGLVLQMFHDVLDEGHLHVWRIGDFQRLHAMLGVQMYGFVGEHRETDLAVVTDDLDAVGARRLVGAEAPRAAAGQSIHELEGGTDGVLAVIEAGTVGAEAADTNDGAEEFLKEVELMGREVVEVAAASDVTLYAPGQLLAVVVEVTGRHGEANLYAHDLADGAALHQFLHLLEVGQIAAVVGHEAGDTGLT